MDQQDIEIWRRFKSGESAESIGRHFESGGDVGIGTILKIILLVEKEMGSSHLFYEQGFDAEGCPDPVPKIRVKIPSSNQALEKWLRGNLRVL